MFLIREAFRDDLDEIHSVARHLNTVNLPHDRKMLEDVLTTSERSFTGDLDVFERESVQAVRFPEPGVGGSEDRTRAPVVVGGRSPEVGRGTAAKDLAPAPGQRGDLAPRPVEGHLEPVACDEEARCGLGQLERPQLFRIERRLLRDLQRKTNLLPGQLVAGFGPGELVDDDEGQVQPVLGARAESLGQAERDPDDTDAPGRDIQRPTSPS